MPRRGRIRRAFRLAALTASAVALALSIGLWCVGQSSQGYAHIAIGYGERPFGFGVAAEQSYVQVTLGEASLVKPPDRLLQTNFQLFDSPYGMGHGLWPKLYVGPRLFVSCTTHLWLPTLLFALSTALLTRFTLRARGARCRGLCSKCHYDLAGLAPSPDGVAVPCPECGAANLT
jgi:hypothetical protein